ncbi:MAG TPA: radical SAM protein [Polyangiaceae bacterium]|jgi:MoaA/NifB/PqqE/SkfB family radical SAM enzyme|nr:radical SAM protein [Polyangiaceae bacterium]
MKSLLANSGHAGPQRDFSDGTSLAKESLIVRISTLLAVAGARVFRKATPVAVGFELTHLCNLACAYCDRHTPLPHEMSLEQILEALDGLFALGMREISLDGGEPLTHREVGTIVDWLTERKVVVRMNTNGILVRRRASVVEKLSKVKISLDGPPAVHDSARGVRAFGRALDGAQAARELGVAVEFTCVVGRHNAHSIDELLGIVEHCGIPIIFQPARDSLFVGEKGPGQDYRLEGADIVRAFSRIEEHKRRGANVLNRWASLRHFRNFPRDTPIPCAAGWINVTMDPEGYLHHCGQVRRTRSHSVVELGVAEAFARLSRTGCGQCWCARVVEENYAWGGRFDYSLPAAEQNLPDEDLPSSPRGALIAAGSLVRRAGRR